jgi:hypothetical protein
VVILDPGALIFHDGTTEEDMNRILFIAVSSFMILGLSTVGSAQSGSVSIQWGDPPAPPPPPPGPVYQQPGGPPPHAPAHDYRAKHQYRYYPYQNVYYEQARGMYFYLSGNGWSFGASLPTSLTVASLGTYVSIGLDTDHPYEHNDEHVKKYPKEKYKGNKGKDDDHGNGNGKGKGGKK